jgi:hypothetical protein
MTKVTRPFSIFLILIACGIGFAAPASAQTEQDLVELLRTQIKADRQAVVAENMNLSEALSEKFWPVYKEYTSRRDSLADRRVAILSDFRDNRMGMTAQQARQILTDALELEADIVSLKRQYVREFQKVLGPRAALRFFQIENKLDAIINFELASVVPLRQ